MNRHTAAIFGGLLGWTLLGYGAGARQGADDHGADDGTSSPPPHRPASRQRLKLRIGDDRGVDASHKFEYRVRNGLVQIKGTAKLWLPSGTPPLDDTSAPDALITAAFTHAGTPAPYAECEFAFDRIVDGRVAQYTFFLKQTDQAAAPRLRVKKGICDTDLDTNGLQPGVPAVVSGDRLEVEFHDEDVSGNPIGLGSGAIE